MPPKSWTLVDVDRDLYLDAWQVTSGDVPGADDAHFTVRKRTLRGGLRDGVEVVELDNGVLQMTLLPDRGMGIWRGAVGELTLGWQSPVRGPVNPRFVPIDEPSGIGWLSGFDEWICRCGLEFNGAPEWDATGKLIHPLHGRIANLPAHRLEVAIDADRREMAVTGVVDEARLFSNKLRLRSTVVTAWDQPGFRIIDEITNLSAQPGELELLYHINNGAPLAVPGSTFLAAIESLAPRDAASAHDVATWQTCPTAQLNTPESVLYMQLAADQQGQSRVLLAAPDGQAGISLSVNRREFPYFALWKNPLLPADGYVVGIEPCINWPNVKSFERAQGRVATLAAGETRRFEIGVEVHTTASGVEQVRGEIRAAQQRVAPQIHQQPRPDWSPT